MIIRSPPPSHYSEFQDSTYTPLAVEAIIGKTYPLVREKSSVCQVRFLIRRCSRLQLDPARINQEWLECSDLSPLANENKEVNTLFCMKRVSQLFICRVRVRWSYVSSAFFTAHNPRCSPLNPHLLPYSWQKGTQGHVAHQKREACGECPLYRARK